MSHAPNPAAKPLLLIDVDGPLNVDLDLRMRAQHQAEGWIFEKFQFGDDVMPVALHPKHGSALLSLTDEFELMWATGWGELANVHIAPRIGLPRLPVLPLDFSVRAVVPTLCWKTDQIAALLAGRSFAWIDDEVSQHDRRRLAGDARVGRHLALRVPAHLGLRDRDIETLRAWATSHPRGQ